MISKLTSAVISLHQIIDTVSKKLNSLEKNLRHSHADFVAANANEISHVQILLSNEIEDDDLIMEIDKSI